MNALPSCPRGEQAVGWALHALEPADEEVVAAHLPICHACREMVRQTEQLMFLLASADEQAEPRPELGAELLATVAATAQTPVERREPSLPNVPWGAPATMVAGRSLWHPVRATVRSATADRAEARRGAARRRRATLLVATVLFAVIGFGGIIAHLLDGAPAPPTSQSQVEEAQRVLDQARQRGARHALLAAPTGAPMAVVLLDSTERRIVPVGLPVNEADHTTYVLWGLGAGEPVALGTFDVAPDMREARPVGSMPRVDSYSGYAVSLENGRKVPNSSSSIIIASGQVIN
jgi:hypothetical protein